MVPFGFCPSGGREEGKEKGRGKKQDWSLVSKIGGLSPGRRKNSCRSEWAQQERERGPAVQGLLPFLRKRGLFEEANAS